MRVMETYDKTLLVKIMSFAIHVKLFTNINSLYNLYLYIRIIGVPLKLTIANINYQLNPFTLFRIRL